MPEPNKPDPTPPPQPSHDAVKTQIASLTLRNAELEKNFKEVSEERDGLKKQVVELASIIENDLKADLRVRIMAKSDLKDSDLEAKSVKELQQIDEILSVSKGGEATYKNIRAGNASVTERSTVGNLYGKSKAEILAMQGEF